MKRMALCAASMLLLGCLAGCSTTPQNSQEQGNPVIKEEISQPLGGSEALGNSEDSSAQSGYEGTIYQYNYDNVISRVCIASCCAGAFLYFETNCPEVRGGSPGCRSPPSPVSVTHPPNTETEVYL